MLISDAWDGLAKKLRYALRSMNISTSQIRAADVAVPVVNIFTRMGHESLEEDGITLPFEI